MTPQRDFLRILTILVSVSSVSGVPYWKQEQGKLREDQCSFSMQKMDGVSHQEENWGFLYVLLESSGVVRKFLPDVFQALPILAGSFHPSLPSSPISYSTKESHTPKAGCELDKQCTQGRARLCKYVLAISMWGNTQEFCRYKYPRNSAQISFTSATIVPLTKQDNNGFS